MKYLLLALLVTVAFSNTGWGAEENEQAELDRLRKELVDDGIPITTTDRFTNDLLVNPQQTKIFSGTPKKVQEEYNAWMIRFQKVLVSPESQFYAMDKEFIFITVFYSFKQRYEPQQKK